MRESTLIAKSSIRRASPQLRLRTGLAWGIAVAVDAWLVWLKWWRLPNTIREITVSYTHLTLPTNSLV